MTRPDPTWAYILVALAFVGWDAAGRFVRGGR